MDISHIQRDETSNIDIDNLLFKASIKLELETDESSEYMISKNGIEMFVPDRAAHKNKDEEPSGYYRKIANFAVIPKGLIVEKTLNSSSDKFEVMVIKGDKILGTIILDNKMLLNGAWVSQHFGRFGCTVYQSSDYARLRTIIILLYSEEVRINQVYATIGWIDDGSGLKYLLYDKVISTDQKNSKSIRLSDEYRGYSFSYNPKVTTEDMAKFVLGRLPKLAPKHVIYPILAFSILSLLKSLFNSYSFKIETALMLVGPSGAKKTTLAKLLLNPYDKYKENVPLNMQATMPAIELLSHTFRDAPLICDDVAPCLDRNQLRQRDEKFEKICRMTGDSIGRQKMGLKERPEANASICFTGEVVPNLPPSTLARLFLVNIGQSDVNLKQLTKLQKSQSSNFVYTSFLCAFLQDICENEHLIDCYKECFLGYQRKFFKKLEGVHTRLINSCAWICVAFNAILRFFHKKKYLELRHGQKMLEELTDVLTRLAIDQNKMVVACQPVKLFLQAFNDLLYTNKFQICEVLTVNKRNTAVQSTKSIHAYEDPLYYYFFKSELYNSICSFYGKDGSAFPWTENELFRVLDEAGILLRDKNRNQSNTVKKTINGKTMRLIRLDKFAIKKHIEEDVE